MTTVRYGLGYNKDGVLGVAGLLGGTIASKIAGVFAAPWGWNTPATESTLSYHNAKDNFSEPLELTGSVLSSSYFGNHKRGGKYVVWSNDTYYSPTGWPLIQYTDGTSVNNVESITTPAYGTISVVDGSQYVPSAINYSDVTKRFYVVLQNNQIAMHILFSTEDFVNWTHHGTLPFQGYYMSGLFVANEDGSMAVYYPSQNFYAYSADGATWTTLYISQPLPGAYYSVLSNSLSPILLYSDYWSNTGYIAVDVNNSANKFGSATWSPQWVQSTIAKSSGENTTIGIYTENNELIMHGGNGSYLNLTAVKIDEATGFIVSSRSKMVQAEGSVGIFMQGTPVEYNGKLYYGSGSSNIGSQYRISETDISEDGELATVNYMFPFSQQETFQVVGYKFI